MKKKFSVVAWLRAALAVWSIAVSGSALSGDLDNLVGSISREWNNCFSGGCDVIWKVNQRIDDGIKSKTKSMAQGVIEEFEPAVGRLMDEQIRPLLEDIDVMIRNNMKDTAEIALSRLDETITNSLFNAEITSKNIAKFVIENAGNEFDEQRKQLVADVNQIISVVDCAVEGQRVAIENYIEKKFDGFKWPWSRTACQVKLGLNNDRGSYSNSELYRETVCEYSRRMTVTTDVKTLLFLYGDLQGLAARFQCLERMAPAAAANYTGDWLKYGRSHAVWQKTQ